MIIMCSTYIPSPAWLRTISVVISSGRGMHGSPAKKASLPSGFLEVESMYGRPHQHISIKVYNTAHKRYIFCFSSSENHCFDYARTFLPGLGVVQSWDVEQTCAHLSIYLRISMIIMECIIDISLTLPY
jgi:hypothetical protein